MAAGNDIALNTYTKAVRKSTAKRARDASQLVAAFVLFFDLPGRCGYDPNLMMGVILLGMSVLDTPETRELARVAGAKMLEQFSDDIAMEQPLPQAKLMLAILETEPTEDLRQKLQALQFERLPTASPLPHYVGVATAANLKPILAPVGGTMAPYKPPGAWLARAAIRTGTDVSVEEETTLPKTELGPSADDAVMSLPVAKTELASAKVIEALSDPQFNGMSPDTHADEDPSEAEAQDNAAVSARRQARSGDPQGADAPAPTAMGRPPATSRTRRERILPPVQPSLAGSRARGVG